MRNGRDAGEDWLTGEGCAGGGGGQEGNRQIL